MTIMEDSCWTFYGSAVIPGLTGLNSVFSSTDCLGLTVATHPGSKSLLEARIPVTCVGIGADRLAGLGIRVRAGRVVVMERVVIMVTVAAVISWRVGGRGNLPPRPPPSTPRRTSTLVAAMEFACLDATCRGAASGTMLAAHLGTFASDGQRMRKGPPSAAAPSVSAPWKTDGTPTPSLAEKATRMLARALTSIS